MVVADRQDPSTVVGEFAQQRGHRRGRRGVESRGGLVAHEVAGTRGVSG